MLKKSKQSSDRSFGILFALIGILGAIYEFIHQNRLYVILLCAFCSSILFVLALFFSSRLNFLNKCWNKLGGIMGHITGPVVLGVLFFLLLTPVAVVARVFGYDPLRLKSSNDKTYWIARTESIHAESFWNQF